MIRPFVASEKAHTLICLFSHTQNFLDLCMQGEWRRRERAREAEAAALRAEYQALEQRTRGVSTSDFIFMRLRGQKRLLEKLKCPTTNVTMYCWPS